MDEVLDFRLFHAAARDAVLTPFDEEALAKEIRALGMAILTVSSAATGRAEYLQRPDLGRQLSAESRAALTEFAEAGPVGEPQTNDSMAEGHPSVGLLAAETPSHDLVIIAADGLSTQAAAQIVPLLAGLLPALRNAGWRMAPAVVASQARVALQDEIGEILRARLSLMLLGERPGLDSADSLGAYFTWDPKGGRTDAERNCLSNIRAAGLAPAAAAVRLFDLLTKARRLELSGTALKDEAPAPMLQGRRD